MTSRWNLAEG